jgi:regulator of replication initiation timing
LCDYSLASSASSIKAVARVDTGLTVRTPVIRKRPAREMSTQTTPTIGGTGLLSSESASSSDSNGMCATPLQSCMMSPVKRRHIEVSTPGTTERKGVRFVDDDLQPGTPARKKFSLASDISDDTSSLANGNDDDDGESKEEIGEPRSSSSLHHEAQLALTLVESKEHEIASLKQQLADLTSTHGDLANDTATLTTELTALRQQKDALESRLSEGMKEHLALQQRAEDAYARVEALTRESLALRQAAVERQMADTTCLVEDIARDEGRLDKSVDVAFEMAQVAAAQQAEVRAEYMEKLEYAQGLIKEFISRIKALETENASLKAKLVSRDNNKTPMSPLRSTSSSLNGVRSPLAVLSPRAANNNTSNIKSPLSVKVASLVASPIATSNTTSMTSPTPLSPRIKMTSPLPQANKGPSVTKRLVPSSPTTNNHIINNENINTSNVNNNDDTDDAPSTLSMKLRGGKVLGSKLSLLPIMPDMIKTKSGDPIVPSINTNITVMRATIDTVASSSIGDDDVEHWLPEKKQAAKSSSSSNDTSKFEVRMIIGHRDVKVSAMSAPERHYLVVWKGAKTKKYTKPYWVPLRDLSCPSLIDQYTNSGSRIDDNYCSRFQCTVCRTPGTDVSSSSLFGAVTISSLYLSLESDPY